MEPALGTNSWTDPALFHTFPADPNSSALQVIPYNPNNLSLQKRPRSDSLSSRSAGTNDSPSKRQRVVSITTPARAADLLEFTPALLQDNAVHPLIASADRASSLVPLTTSSITTTSVLAVSSTSTANEVHEAPIHSHLNATPASMTADQALSALAAASFESNTILITDQQATTQTGDTYKGHLTRYEKWWAELQAQKRLENPSYPVIDSHPITATKVYLFIEHERGRKKQKRASGGKSVEIEGTTLGKSSISGAISALESYRSRHQHLYPDNPEARTKLRDDHRITTIETAAKHDEPTRVAKAQTMKAAGSSAGTYAVDELVRMSRWSLTIDSASDHKAAPNLRDRAMLLMSTSTAFRGNSTRDIELSDIFIKPIPFPEFKPGYTVPALMILSDNAKNNTTGRVDEFGTLRHRIVDLCAVGAVAIQLFAQFHMSGLERPNFSPDFSDESKKDGWGEYGKREWYALKLFTSCKKGADHTESITYTNHAQRVNRMHTKCEVAVKAVTHAARGYAATNSRQHRATEHEVKALGGWNSGEGSYRACYERSVPLGAMLGAANFNGQKPQDYRLPRASLVPPEGLAEQIFPWAEEELEALRHRKAANKLAKDIALKGFLQLLVWLRTVLLQDAALLFGTVPDCRLFQHSPFNSSQFQQFAAVAQGSIQAIETQMLQELQDVPEHLATGLRNYLNTFSVAQESQWSRADDRLGAMERTVTELKEMLVPLSIQQNGGQRGRPVRISAPLVGNTPTRPAQLAPPKAGASAPIVNNLVPPQTFVVNVSVSASPAAPSSTSSALCLPEPQQARSEISSTPVEPAGNALATNATAVPAMDPVITASADSAEPPSGGGLTPAQQQKWQGTLSSYSTTVIAHHQPWEWIKDEWTPTYKPFTRDSALTLDEVWAEYHDGIGGCLSVLELTRAWSARWKRNEQKYKPEWTRRGKLISLVIRVSKHRANWNHNIALRFLKERYGHLNARGLADALGRKMSVEDVLAEVDKYQAH